LLSLTLPWRAVRNCVSFLVANSPSPRTS
jgi:hypothetical protein